MTLHIIFKNNDANFLRICRMGMGPHEVTGFGEILGSPTYKFNYKYQGVHHKAHLFQDRFEVFTDDISDLL